MTCNYAAVVTDTKRGMEANWEKKVVFRGVTIVIKSQRSNVIADELNKRSGRFKSLKSQMKII